MLGYSSQSAHRKVGRGSFLNALFGAKPSSKSAYALRGVLAAKHPHPHESEFTSFARG
jgi:hypothetical protein